MSEKKAVIHIPIGFAIGSLISCIYMAPELALANFMILNIGYWTRVLFEPKNEKE